MTDKELDELEARLDTLSEWLLQQGFEDESWPVCDAKNALSELRVKNAGLVGRVERLKAIARPLADEEWNPDEYPCDAPATCLDLLRHQARHVLKENTQ